MYPGPRVLVAEDDRDLLRDVAEVLEQGGASVVRVESGAELIVKMAEDGPFDLVVTDIAMPWMSGLQAMHSARYAGMSTPVIVMTALRDEGLAEQVGSLGSEVVLLRKPFELADLEAAAARLVAEARARP
jgi:CheY-like chemotaxis protein